MDNILRNIQDPSWWFSAVAVAIIASVVAGFLRDLLPKWFNRYSNRAKRINYRRRKILARTIKAFKFNNNFYLSTALHLQREITMLGFSLIMLLALAPLHYFFNNLPQYDPLHDKIANLSSNTVGVAVLVFLLINMVPRMYLLGRKLTLMAYMHRRYRREAISKLKGSSTPQVDFRIDRAGLAIM